MDIGDGQEIFFFRIFRKNGVDISANRFRMAMSQTNQNLLMLKIEFLNFRGSSDVSGRLTGAIWEVVMEKHFFSKIPPDLGSKTSIFTSKIMIFRSKTTILCGKPHAF